jgi:drug/metabolite transporter (DMT)-like permease
MKKNKVIVGMLAVGFAAFLWSLDGIILRPKLYLYPVSIIVFLEHIFGLILLSPIVFIYWKDILKIKKEIWLALAWVAVFGGLIGTLTITKSFFLAFDGKVSFSTVIILQKLQPVFALLMARAILKEKLSNKFYLWAGLAVAASYLLAFGKDGFNVELFNLDNQAVWFALLAAFAFGSSTVFGKKLVGVLSFPLATFLRFALTTILAGVLVAVLNNFSAIKLISFEHWEVLGVIIFTSGTLAMYIYYFGLKKISASLATIMELVYPLAAIILDCLVNKNVLTPLQIVATILLLVSFYKVVSLRKKHWEVAGEVVHGKKRGRELGFPTANVKLKGESVLRENLLSGVYEGVVIVDKIKYKGAIFIGEERDILEVYLLNFDKSLYGLGIKIIIGEKIRKTKKFKNQQDLIKQIKKDVENIK